LAIREGRSAQRVSELHRSSYPDAAVSRAFLSFDQLRIGDPLAVCGSEQRVDAIAFFEHAPIVAPRKLVKVAVEMFGANEVVDAEHLPFEVRPRAFQPVDVAEVVADILAETVIDGVVIEATFQPNVARELIAHDVGAGLYVFNDLALNGLGGQIVNLHRPYLAATFKHAEYSRFADAASPGVPPLPFVLIPLFAADESFVDLDLTSERLVERFRLGGLAQPMCHEPRGLLCHSDITGELRAGDALLVTGDQPDCDEPLFQRQLRVLEDRSDLDGEPLPAVAALVSLIVREMVDSGSAAVRAERTIGPADRAEMPDAGLLVRESGGQFLKGIEVLQHARLQPTREI
jgi:hypothetical protein